MGARVARASWLALWCFAGCARPPEASPAASTSSVTSVASVAAPSPPKSATAASPAKSPLTAPAPSGAHDATAAGGVTDGAGHVTAEAGPFDPLVDESGRPLPQTDAQPSASSPAFRRRMQLLVQAIADDNPAIAEPAFFPLIAYREVKAIDKPERDWKARLFRAFERNIHDYHRKLGPDAASAKLHSVTLRETAVRFMKPGSEGNRVGYFRVTRNQLRVSLANGTERTFEITSLISWRGEWFVVHLDGFG